LWHTLVIKEQLQKIFLDFAFGQNSSRLDKSTGVVSILWMFICEGEDVCPLTWFCFQVDDTDHPGDGEAKILYKDSEALNSFCISKTISMRIVVATMRDVQEIDISNMMGIPRTFYIDENVSSDPENRKK
jgi:hypothetical protein